MKKYFFMCMGFLFLGIGILGYILPGLPGTIFLIILYLILKYVLAWITYFNNLDSRLGDSSWRFTYDYPVIGDRDISDLDDKNFVRLRRKKK